MEEEKDIALTADEAESLRDEVAKLRTESVVNAALLDAGVKNVAAVKGVLADYVNSNRTEDGNIPGLGDKLNELASDSQTAFLFKDSISRYLGATPEEGNSQFISDEMGYEAELRNARQSGDFLKAIRVKQEAAKEGIILI